MASAAPKDPPTTSTDKAWTNNSIDPAVLKILATVPLQPLRVMLARVNETVPFSKATAVLDIAAGAGTVFKELFAAGGMDLPAGAQLTAEDISSQMLDGIRKLQQEKPAEWNRVKILEGNAADLSVSSDSQSHVTSQLGIYMVEKPDEALKEAHRVLAPDGVFAMTTLAEAEWMDVLSLVNKLYPAVQVPQIGKIWQNEDSLREKLESAGFHDVQITTAPLAMGFDDPEKVVSTCWTAMPFMAGLTKDLSEQEKADARKYMVETVKRTHPEMPSELKGNSLVAVARK